MSDPPRHAATPLEVTVMYEPTRFAQDTLHVAYATVLPMPRRRIVIHQPDRHDEDDLDRRAAGGRA
jgi:hypothetical protein